MSSDTTDESYDPTQDDEGGSDYSISEESYNSDSEDDDRPIAGRDLGGGWSRVPDLFSDVRPDEEPEFLSNYIGANPDVGFSNDMSVYDCYKHFITDEVIEYLCQCTNDRAAKFFSDNPDKKGFINHLKWKPVSVDDMHVFLALHMYTGISKFHELNHYWARMPMRPGIHFYTPEVMSRDRFLSILKFLRFSMVADVKPGDASSRLNKFTEKLTDISMKNVDAGQHISIDEALMLYKGRLIFKQYIPAKRARFGIKMFVMCNADRNYYGYNWNFCIYYGKDSYEFAQSLDVSSLSKSEKVVVFLSQFVLGQGRHIVVDNWYSSARLAMFLEEHNTLVTGTIRANRGLPKELISEKLSKGKMAFVRKNNVLIVKWEDKKTVNVITTKYAAGTVDEEKKVYGRRTVIRKPTPVSRYNQYMGAVDYTDEILAPVDPNRKSQAWFKKLGLHMVLRMVFDSHIVYGNFVKKIPIKTYIETLIYDIIVKHSRGGKAVMDRFKAANPRATRKRKEPPPRVVHLLTVLTAKPGAKKQNPSKRCKVCYNKQGGKRRDTRKCCPGCPGSPGLCSEKCFMEWHSGKK